MVVVVTCSVVVVVGSRIDYCNTIMNSYALMHKMQHNIKIDGTPGQDF